MPGSAATLRATGLFRGGMVTALTPDQLKGDQSPFMEDVFLAQGPAIERGGWAQTGEAAVLGGGVNYESSQAILFPDQTAADLVVMATGKVGIATSPGRSGNATDSVHLVSTSSYRPGIQWQGEELIPVQDGESPILRFGGNLNTLTQGAGTIAITAGSTLVTGAGTSFSANWVGAYIRTKIDSVPDGYHRIVSVESTTRLTVDAPFNVTVSGIVWILSRFGMIGLEAQVTDLGAASGTNASVTVTGKGTGWDSTPKTGYGRPMFYAGGDRADVDSFATVPRLAALPWSRINAVASDTSMTVNLAATANFTDVPYRVARRMPGRVICAHKNRLYICGVAWEPRRLYISPAGYNCATTLNGIQSIDTDTGRATLMANEDIPGPSTPGVLNALLSLPSGGLGIFSEQDFYLGWGEHPAFQAVKVADVGCFGQRAALAVDEGAWFAGPQGVFEIVGNREQLISGAIDPTWRALMAEGTVTCDLGMVDDHLYVSVHTASSNKTLMWDRARRVWLGYMTLPSTLTGLDSARIPGQPDRLYMSYGATRLGELSTTIFHTPTMPVTSNLGRFNAYTPSNIAGSTGQLKRVTGLKVGYVCQGTGALTLDVLAALTPDDASPTLEKSLPVGNLQDLTHRRVPPNSGNLGREGRQFQLRFRRSAAPTTVARVGVHELELNVRSRRARA